LLRVGRAVIPRNQPPAGHRHNQEHSTVKELGSAIVEQIKNVLAAVDQEKRLLDARIKELEAQGYRIVSFGQISSGDEPLELECEDWRTGEVIWTGDDEDAAPSDDWCNIDFIREEIGLVDPVKVKGLPDCTIEEMATNHEDKIRELVVSTARAPHSGTLPGSPRA
jgi:hypothetical protein